MGEVKFFQRKKSSFNRIPYTMNDRANECYIDLKKVIKYDNRKWMMHFMISICTIISTCDQSIIRFIFPVRLT